jgi:hypothetical protein
MATPGAFSVLLPAVQRLHWLSALVIRGSSKPSKNNVMTGRSKFTGFIFPNLIAVAK